ncbi:MAG: zinc ABC transporter substrate-binding protein [Candidatus Symbiothrix sp.]|jgi:zinc transport system substrate-binding protein|nr:zinc ABC transporter substrate-binding protein [Candidatus Symbiothrix sp.]
MYQSASFKYIPLLLLLFACSKPAEQENRITVSIEPQRYFAEQLTDSLFEIITMVPPGSSPESYDPTPQQMTQLSRSKAYFGIGPIGFELAWLDRFKQNNPKVVFFDNSEGIPNIHHHADDPHSWASPKEARIIVQNMYQALVQIDSMHTETYQANLTKLLKEIDTTDRIVQSCLAQTTPKAFIIYHPALSYFARDYGLKQYAIETDGKEPSPEQLKQLVDIVKKENIRTIFIQQEFNRNNAEIIAQETGCRLEIINPLAYNWQEEVIRIAKTLCDE